jgi:hypothetical protein
VGHQHAVDAPDAVREALAAEIRRRVDQQRGVAGLDENGGAEAPVARIGERHVAQSQPGIGMP